MSYSDYMKFQELGKPKAYYGKCFGHGQSSALDTSFLFDRLQSRTEDIFFIKGSWVNLGGLSVPFQGRFCPTIGYQNIYSLVSEKGKVLLLDSNKPTKKSLLLDWDAHANAIFDMCWVDQHKLITASGDRTAVLWDVLSQKALATFNGHTCSLKTVSIHPSNPNVFASGGRDGNLLIWDIRCKIKDSNSDGKFLIGDAHDGFNVLHNPRPKRRKFCNNRPNIDPVKSISCIQYQDENILLTSGASDSRIKGWDLRNLSNQASYNTKKLLLFILKYPEKDISSHGVTSIVLHPNQNSFFANCTDGVIYHYTSSKPMPKLVSTYYGHRVNSFFVRMDISGDGNYLISGSSDNQAYIWNVAKPGGPILKLTGHSAEVTAVAWCPSDLLKIVTCSDDDKVLNWHSNDKEATNTFKHNPIFGKAEKISSNEICLRMTPRQSKIEFSTLLSPQTPSSRSPVLTQWFTPKNRKIENISEPTPPKTPILQNALFDSSSEPNTPIATNDLLNTSMETPTKAQCRPALCDLSLDWNSSDNDSFTQMRRRLREEIICNFRYGRRTLHWEVPREENDEGPSTSSATNLKENVDGFGTNVDCNSINGSTPKKALPKKGLKRCLDTNIEAKSSYSIKKFFSVIPSSKNV